MGDCIDVQGTATQDLVGLAARARTAGRIGLDTEFMSEGRYRPLLCLVQVTVDGPDGPLVEVLDPLPGGDPPPLAALLADPEVQVIVHAGRQDVAILRREWSTDVVNIFDTQVVAGFAGFGAQSGYGGLLSEALGVRVDKTASFTRWDTRPLTPEQLGYAKDDVAYLLQLADQLTTRLEGTDRLEWALEECRRLEEATDQREAGTEYLRLPKIGQLRSRARTVAAELASWRERTAAEEDRPVGHVLSDPALLEVAKRQPSTPSQLEQIRGIPPATLRRRSREVLAAVQRGLTAPVVPAPNGSGTNSQPSDAPLIALADALTRARALEAGLASELVATKSDLVAIVAAVRTSATDPDVRTLRGWRRDLVGGELLDLLAGRRTLAVGPSGRLLVRGPERAGGA